MGPGLFLAWGLLAAGAGAEPPVGLAARGVDPRAAVENRWGLDVRDEQGRPVSGELVLAELKAASAVRAAANAFASSAPKAAAALSALETLAGVLLSIKELAPARPLAAAVAGLPFPRPKVSAVSWALVAALAAAVSGVSAAALSRAPARCPRRDRPSLLRC